MAIGTPFHARTAALNKSLDWRQWSGYFATGHYQDFHQPEYSAIRNGAALIDVSPLNKYLITGPGAVDLVDRVITRNARKCRIGQVIYTPWCDEQGKVLQEGTVVRLDGDRFQLNAAEPAIGWLRLNAAGLEVKIEDRSAALAALSIQGPKSRALLAAVCADGGVEDLKFFRATHADVGGARVLITRTGFTGDLGYELWIDAGDAVGVWDVLMEAGNGHGVAACGLQAMDVARIEAGFILIGVDYISAEEALIPSQRSSPYELELGWSVKLGKKTGFVGRDALARERDEGSAWRLRGLEIAWEPLEALYAEADLMPDLPTVAWREPVPVYAGNRQVGRATSGCWSTLLKKYVALASLEADWAKPGTTVDMEVTVDYQRQRAPAKIVELPFFRPPRMRG
ncbi:MAG: aminomethyltransferase family protein [Thermoanaerobaculia bacterium]